ncbi:family 10 glycosylhydrolase [Rapidithrix thailandica]|uniref:Family 10 glycosylhydrolase n=1 Tax=Rapidithrix thailandica TaxID=413964 RepID=A0AAW9RX10_9BACT
MPLIHKQINKQALRIFCWQLALLYSLFSKVYAQNPSPKREFRGVWVSTVANLDWPSQKGLSARQQQNEFIEILDHLKKCGINTVIVQVRPAANTLYPSNSEPWSEWITNDPERGPNYDPVEFMIYECRRRGMEFHAWFNPFRAMYYTQSREELPENHLAHLKPEWIVTYGSTLYLNPGIPEVRQYVIEQITEVVRKYNVDAVHLDDYFYPYPIPGRPFEDKHTFSEFASNTENLHNWRRANIDQFVQALHEAIQQEKKHVKLGISPFGVWRNKEEDPQFGSATEANVTAFDANYADVRKWLQKHWVDYVIPQIYWSQQFPEAPFGVLARWWAQNHFNRHVYTGHAAYKIQNNADSTWNNPEELPAQIRLTRTLHQSIQGNALFSCKSVLHNTGHLSDSLQEHLFQYPALIPTMPWKDNTPPLAPKKLKTRKKQNGIKLKWHKPAPAEDGERPYRYIIYKFKEKEVININHPRHILAVLPGCQRWFLDQQGQDTDRYVVTALDRMNNESRLFEVSLANHHSSD